MSFGSLCVPTKKYYSLGLRNLTSFLVKASLNWAILFRSNVPQSGHRRPNLDQMMPFRKTVTGMSIERKGHARSRSFSWKRRGLGLSQPHGSWWQAAGAGCSCTSCPEPSAWQLLTSEWRHKRLCLWQVEKATTPSLDPKNAQKEGGRRNESSFTDDPQHNVSNRCLTSKNPKLTSTWRWLRKQPFKACDYVLPSDSPCYDNNL